MGQSPYWEANRFSASQEIPHILWNQLKSRDTRAIPVKSSTHNNRCSMVFS